MLPHLAADVGKHLVAVLEFDPEHRVRECFEDGAFDFDGAVFLGQVLHTFVTGLVA